MLAGILWSGVDRKKKIVSEFGWDDHLLGCSGQFHPAGLWRGQAGFLAVILSGVFGSHNIYILYRQGCSQDKRMN